MHGAMETETGFYRRALERVYLDMAWVTALAAAGVVVWRGWLAGLAFVLGAAGSYLNFRWMHQVVDAIGADGRPAPKRVYAFFALRYVLLGVGGYVIVKVFGMNAIAALAGLFVPVAAIICEILYELVHGT
jgi:hypothetical protein